MVTIPDPSLLSPLQHPSSVPSTETEAALALLTLSPTVPNKPFPPNSNNSDYFRTTLGHHHDEPPLKRKRTQSPSTNTTTTDDNVPNAPSAPSTSTPSSDADVTPTEKPAVADTGIIRCICGFDDDDGSTIFCDGCGVWQHMSCVLGVQAPMTLPVLNSVLNPTTPSAAPLAAAPPPSLPEKWFCERCVPREYDPARARETQLRRREIEKAKLLKERELLPHPTTTRRRRTATTSGNDPAAILGASRKPSSTAKGKSAAAKAMLSPPSLTFPIRDPSPSSSAAVAAATLSSPLGSPVPSLTDSWAGEYIYLERDTFQPGEESAVRNRIQRWKNWSNELPNPSQDDCSWNSADSASWSFLPVRLRPNDQLRSAPGLSVRPIPSSLSLPIPSPATPASPHTYRPPQYGLFVSNPYPAHTLLTLYPSTLSRLSTYTSSPTSQYGLLSMPKPFVRLMGGPLGLTLDAREAGGEARWIRNGCRPNAVLRPVLRGAPGTGSGDVEMEDGSESEEGLAFAVFALRDIKAREEIVLGWEWDDRSAVHDFKKFLEGGSLDDTDVCRMKERIGEILATLSGTFASCACCPPPPSSHGAPASPRLVGSSFGSHRRSSPTSTATMTSSHPQTQSPDCVFSQLARFVFAPSAPGYVSHPTSTTVDLGPCVGIERGIRMLESNRYSHSPSSQSPLSTKHGGVNGLNGCLPSELSNGHPSSLKPPPSYVVSGIYIPPGTIPTKIVPPSTTMLSIPVPPLKKRRTTIGTVDGSLMRPLAATALGISGGRLSSPLTSVSGSDNEGGGARNGSNMKGKGKGKRGATADGIECNDEVEECLPPRWRKGWLRGACARQLDFDHTSSGRLPNGIRDQLKPVDKSETTKEKQDERDVDGDIPMSMPQQPDDTALMPPPALPPLPAPDSATSTTSAATLVPVISTTTTPPSLSPKPSTVTSLPPSSSPPNSFASEELAPLEATINASSSITVSPQEHPMDLSLDQPEDSPQPQLQPPQPEPQAHQLPSDSPQLLSPTSPKTRTEISEEPTTEQSLPSLPPPSQVVPTSMTSPPSVVPALEPEVEQEPFAITQPPQPPSEAFSSAQSSSDIMSSPVVPTIECPSASVSPSTTKDGDRDRKPGTGPASMSQPSPTKTRTGFKDWAKRKRVQVQELEKKQQEEREAREKEAKERAAEVGVTEPEQKDEREVAETEREDKVGETTEMSERESAEEKDAADLSLGEASMDVSMDSERSDGAIELPISLLNKGDEPPLSSSPPPVGLGLDIPTLPIPILDESEAMDVDVVAPLPTKPTLVLDKSIPRRPMSPPPPPPRQLEDWYSESGGAHRHSSPYIRLDDSGYSRSRHYPPDDHPSDSHGDFDYGHYSGYGMDHPVPPAFGPEDGEISPPTSHSELKPQGHRSSFSNAPPHARGNYDSRGPPYSDHFSTSTPPRDFQPRYSSHSHVPTQPRSFVDTPPNRYPPPHNNTNTFTSRRSYPPPNSNLPVQNYRRPSMQQTPQRGLPIAPRSWYGQPGPSRGHPPRGPSGTWDHQRDGPEPWDRQRDRDRWSGGGARGRGW